MAARLAPEIELPRTCSSSAPPTVRFVGWPASPVLTLMFLLASLRRSR